MGLVGYARCRRVDVDPARAFARPVPVDRLDPVGVASLRRRGVVGVRAGGGARVRDQFSELALSEGIPVTPQDHVAGDALVLGVVPGKDHLASCVAVASRPLGLSGAEPSWACAGEKSMAIARAAMTARRTGKRRLSVRVIFVPKCGCVGVWDAGRPVRRRQPPPHQPTDAPFAQRRERRWARVAHAGMSRTRLGRWSEGKSEGEMNVCTSPRRKPDRLPELTPTRAPAMAVNALSECLANRKRTPFRHKLMHVDSYYSE